MAEEKQYTFEELKKKLTNKERIFCHEYIIDWNGARAAKQAGYSEKSIYEIAYQNLIKLHIKQYINYIKNNLEEESGISKLRNLKELAKIAYSSIAHLHNTWIEKKEFDSLTDDQKAAIETIETKTVTMNYDESTKEVEYVKISLYSKQAAIQEINKMMGYNAAIKTEISGEITNKTNLSELTTEELIRRAEAMRTIERKKNE
jgi:phage terminase small subunit